MRWEKIWFICIAFFCCFHMEVYAGGITQYPPLNRSEFWEKLNPGAQELVLTPEQIHSYNQKIIAKSSSVVDLAALAETCSLSMLQNYMREFDSVLQEEVYVKGKLLTEQQKMEVAALREIDSADQTISVRYAVTVNRTNLRALPTLQGWFGSPVDHEFDLLQLTAVDPAEPLIVLRQDVSGRFFYVQMRYYRGWIFAEDIAFTERSKWLEYVNPQEFLVVLKNHYSLIGQAGEQNYQMGSRILLDGITEGGYRVRVPMRAAQGNLQELRRQIPLTPDLHRGYLAYTRANLLRQAFQFLGDPYGWGGLKNSVDCSSFIADVYRTVGIELPRDADQQELTAGRQISFEGLSSQDRQAEVAKLFPSDALFFDGHVMLYLGMTNQTPYILHSLGSHTMHKDGVRNKIYVMQVVVSDLSLTRYNGNRFLDSLTSAKSFH